MTKVRNACYCDCAIKEAKKLNKMDSSDDTLVKKSQPQRNGQIQYEGETDDEEEEESKCACICHGTYSDRVVENEDGSELTLKKYEPFFFCKFQNLQNKSEQIQRVPKIFYTTRTHKQITNVIKEFKKTVYAQDVR